MDSYLDQDDFWTQFDANGFVVDDVTEPQSERSSSEARETSENPPDISSARSTRRSGDYQARDEGTSTPAPPALSADDSPRYTLEWKVIVNGKQVAKQTEPNLILAPNTFWEATLQPKLSKLLARKFANKPLRADDTSALVSVTDRSERDLHMHFDGVDIDWTALETQLQAWSHLLQTGKKLRIDVSFNYVDPGGAASSSQRGAKRKYPSATQDMLAQRAVEMEAEENATGVPPVWKRVYGLMRCPGPPCHLGPHCWIDGVGKRHYKLRTHHLEGLIKHVQLGGTLESHDDVPEEIREQLYAEEQQASERQRKRRAPSPASYPPINITNVMPALSPLAETPSAGEWQAASVGGVVARTSTLEIPEPLDLAVQRYTDWQCSRFRAQDVRREYQKACEVTLAEGLDLELVYEDQNADFFIAKGVKTGVACRFVRDIAAWVEKSRALI